jgi:hypothetical protein
MTLAMTSWWCHHGAMDLTEYVEALRHSLTAAAAAGGEQARETARLLSDTMEPAVRLTVTHALAAMAAEVTAALDGTVVDIRVRGRDPEVVVVPAEHAPFAPPEETADDAADEDGTTARISLRLPDGLKARAEAAATANGTSLNTWLVRAVTAALREPTPSAGRGPRRYTGFARS